MPYNLHMWRSTFDLLILGVLSHIVRCQNVLEISKKKKNHGNTQHCTVYLFCSQNRAAPTYLHHFLLDTMVSKFSFWLYIFLGSRTKTLLINQPEKNLLKGHLKKLLVSNATCKIRKSQHLSIKYWCSHSSCFPKRLEACEAVKKEEMQTRRGSDERMLFFTCSSKAVVVEGEVFDSRELLWDH